MANLINVNKQAKPVSWLQLLKDYIGSGLRSSDISQLPLTPSVVEEVIRTSFNNNQVEVVSDIELARAMPPKFNLDQYVHVSRQQIPFKDLGSGAWLADLHNMPFMPQQINMLTATVTSQPFSVAHFALALFNKATVLYVPQNATLEFDLATQLTSADEISIELLFVVVENDAQVTIIDSVLSNGFQARALLASIGDRAQVTFISDYQYGEEAYGSEHERWQLGTDTQLNRITSVTGGKQSWHFQNYILGQRASLEQTALTALRGNEQSALITKQQHIGEASKSSVLVKAALSDQSNSFYRGTIAIGEQAKLSEAHQQQRALMLSSKARACAIPSLEVATHDVRCSHGSAAGRFNSEEIGYLCSRGLDKVGAEKLLVRGFFNDPALEKYNDHVFNLQEQLINRCLIPTSAHPE